MNHAESGRTTDFFNSLLEGSTTPEQGQVGEGTPSFPRNLAVVFGQFDEFAPLMWHVEKGSDIRRSRKLEAVFGAPTPVAPGRLYGNIDFGTARVLFNPPITHPIEHFSFFGVGPAIDWFQRTLTGEATPLPASDQIWPWKEAGTLIALIGFVVLLLGTFRLLLATRFFGPMHRAPAAQSRRRNLRWTAAFLLTAAIPALTFYPVMTFGYAFRPTRAFPEWIANQLAIWALANAAISLALSFLPGTPRPILTHRWGRSLIIAIGVFAVGYVALAMSDLLFKTDFRFWVVGLRPLDLRHALDFVAYLPLFTIAFAASLRTALINLPVEGEREGVACAWAAAAFSLGFVILLGVQYGALFSGGVLLTPAEALSTIIAIQFVPILATVGLIGAFTFRRTASYLPASAICGLVITWYIVAGTATHWFPGWRPAKTAGLCPDRPAAAAPQVGR